MLQWVRRLFQGRLQVRAEGRGYRVNGQWCGSQTEVRRRLEELGMSEPEIIRILRKLNRDKYGDPAR